MANIGVEHACELTARDVMHIQTTALDPRTTVAQARDYFAASASRRLAVLADDGRYVGALTPADLEAAADASLPVGEVAAARAIVAPDAPATLAQELAAGSDTRRVPVVDHDGRYLGIVSLNRTLEWFCGTG
jgi:CBS domain-containing protein